MKETDDPRLWAPRGERKKPDDSPSLTSEDIIATVATHAINPDAKETIHHRDVSMPPISFPSFFHINIFSNFL